MRPGVSAVRFATEVAALAALAVAGLAIAWPLALALPAAFAFVRGWWIAPKAHSRLADPSRFAVEIVLLVAAGGTLAATGSVPLGLLLTAVAVAAAIAIRRE